MNKINEVKNWRVRCEAKPVKANADHAILEIYVGSMADEDSREWLRTYAYCGKGEGFIRVKARYNEEHNRDVIGDAVLAHHSFPFELLLKRKMVFGSWCVSADILDAFALE